MDVNMEQAQEDLNKHRVELCVLETTRKESFVADLIDLIDERPNLRIFYSDPGKCVDIIGDIAAAGAQITQALAVGGQVNNVMAQAMSMMPGGEEAVKVGQEKSKEEVQKQLAHIQKVITTKLEESYKMVQAMKKIADNLNISAVLVAREMCDDVIKETYGSKKEAEAAWLTQRDFLEFNIDNLKKANQVMVMMGMPSPSEEDFIALIEAMEKIYANEANRIWPE